MHTAALMAKLLEIGRRAGSEDASAVRCLALEAQEDLLQIERAMIAALSDNNELRRQMEKCEQPREQVRFRAMRAV